MSGEDSEIAPRAAQEFELMAILVAELDTPAVVIDLDIVEANIRRAQDILSGHGLANRPHIKTHKIPALAKMQIEAGAVGITCQKLGEVEVMADAGAADDTLLTYNVLGDAKTERLPALVKRPNPTAAGARRPRASARAKRCGSPICSSKG